MFVFELVIMVVKMSLVFLMGKFGGYLFLELEGRGGVFLRLRVRRSFVIRRVSGCQVGKDNSYLLLYGVQVDLRGQVWGDLCLLIDIVW